MKNLLIILLVIFVSCGTRKTDQIKEVSKIKEAEVSSFTDLSIFRNLEREENFDKSFIYIQEKDGLKQTFIQNNKSSISTKIVDSIRYNTATIYKTTTTYITVKNKKTQTNNNLVWSIGFFLIFVFALIKFR